MGEKTYNLAQNTQISEKTAKKDVMMQSLGIKLAFVVIQKCFFTSVHYFERRLK